MKRNFDFIDLKCKKFDFYEVNFPYKKFKYKKGKSCSNNFNIKKIIINK